MRASWKENTGVTFLPAATEWKQISPVLLKGFYFTNLHNLCTVCKELARKAQRCIMERMWAYAVWLKPTSRRGGEIRDILGRHRNQA